MASDGGEQDVSGWLFRGRSIDMARGPALIWKKIKKSEVNNNSWQTRFRDEISCGSAGSLDSGG